MLLLRSLLYFSLVIIISTNIQSPVHPNREKLKLYVERVDNGVIANAAVHVINSFFVNRVLYISVNNVNEISKFDLIDALTEVLSNVDGISWYLERDEEFLETGYLRYFNVIFIDSYDAFRLMFHRLQNTSIYDATGYYLIVLMHNKNSEYEPILNIFQDCWILYIVNIIILVRIQDIVHLYTYYPYTEQQCGVVVPTIINSFWNGSMALSTFYPEKFFNLYECPVYVITWENPPYIFIKHRSNGLVQLDGIEGQILENLASGMNFTVKFVRGPVENPRGYIFDNGTMTGTFRMLQRREADLSIGSYRYTAKRAKYFSTTHSYYQVPLVIAMSGGSSYSPLERLVYPFEWSMWMALIFLFAVAGLVLVVLRHFAMQQMFLLGAKNSAPMYNMWASSLGGQVNPMPTRNFARFILFLWLFITLVIRGTYQGVLYAFMRTNTQKQLPQRLIHLAADGYTIHIDPPTEELATGNIVLDKVYYVSLESQHAFLLRLQKGLDKTGILCPRDYVIYFNNFKYANGSLHMLDEQVIIQLISIILQKNSFLTKPMDKLLWAYSTGGLIEKWSSEFNRPKYTAGTERYTPKPFSNHNLSGAYVVFGALLVFACVAFFMEMLSIRYRIVRAIIDYVLE